jgi:selenide,water dikinase
VHPEKVITNAGARPGDYLILTKPIGTGVIMAGHRLGMASDNDINDAKSLMKQLNKTGAEVMKRYNLKGATDITGFGLAGHALKMARASNVSIDIEMKKIPLIGDTYRLIDEGCIPGTSFRNLEFAEKDVTFSPDIDYNLKMVAFDAQTSGGLLMSSPPELVESVLTDLHKEGLTSAVIIGVVTNKKERYLNLHD